ncbi:MAG: sigma-70 family RNA polymerase sigma factor [Solirubrobacterales bacterium]
MARRASNGDQQAIAVIFERYQKELYSFCVGLLGEPQDAQDALQNTMVKVLRALPGEEREISLRPWLYRIAHNEAIELRRSRHPTQALESHLVDQLESVSERVEQREQLEWVLRDLADLPERQRSVLVMRELSGLDFAEIGAALDTTGAVVRQSLYEARRNLEQMDRGRSLRCEAVARVLSDSDRRITRRRDIRAHLRDCPDCRRFRDAIEERRGALSAIPLVPFPAAVAGVAQSLAGGSAGGVVAAVSGVAKTIGALKAAGTIAAVAVVGTVAVEGGMMGATPSSPFSNGEQHRAQADSAQRQPGLRVAAGAQGASPSAQFALGRGGVSSVPAGTQVSNRRPRSLSSQVRGAAAVIAPRSGQAPREVGFPADPQGASVKADLALVHDESTHPYEPDGNHSEEGMGSATEKSRAGQIEKDASASAKSPQEKRDHPDHPAHPENGHAPDAAAPSSEARAESAKTPPGQAKKQASAEEPAPAPVTPAPVSSEPTAVEADAAPPDEGAESNGKAKGHEK